MPTATKKPAAKRPKKRYGLRTYYKGRTKITKFRSRNGHFTLLTDRKRGQVARSGCGSIRIGREWWNIVVVAYPLRGAWGYFDHYLHLIVIDGTAKDQNFLDTVLHEASHGLDRRRPERVILQQGNALSEILTAMGYKN